jgi:molecular chaperone HtpG
MAHPLTWNIQLSIRQKQKLNKMSTGKINVQTENIFPIIKKFLYSDHEIFLRELVSNAVDATSKLKTLHKLGEYKDDPGNLRVNISIDKDKGTLTISDNGVGMTEEEVERYLNDIAFSGAEEFLKKYDDKAKDSGIIGHFGLGFYSAFMVAKEVDVITKSYTGGDAVKWSCKGDPEYTLEKADRSERGTDVVLHLDDESQEFLEDNRISGILEKYCKFLPVEIKFGTKTIQVDDPEGKKDDDGNVKKVDKEVENIINNPTPAWTKQPADLTDEDYHNFYRELYPMSFEEPLFHIHLNVDYPFNLTGILYFPKLKNNIQIQRNKIQLYSNQVFITDSVENIVPEFLTLLHGVIDSPDIPLNVSRSYLQEDGNVKKISNHITKKVADKLSSMFDREDYQSKWDDIKVFIEYGMLTDDKFFDKMQKALLLKNTESEFFTIDEYREKIEEKQKDKNDAVVHLYATDADKQDAFIESAKNRGYDVLVMDSPLTSHFVQQLESKLDNVKFVRVDADAIDKLIEKEEQQEANLTDDQKKTLQEVYEGVVEKDKFTVQFENMNEKDNPVVITQPEFMRRMKEQQQVGGGMMGMSNMPDMFNLMINANHPLVSKILTEQDQGKQKSLAKQSVDLAMLSQNMLKGKDLTAFIKRSVDMID